MTQSARERAWHVGSLAALLAIFTAAVFANALGGIFFFDDIGDITANPSSKAETFIERLGVMNRPLTKASYALQDLVHGQNTIWFHAANVALHVLTVALVFLLVRRAARTTEHDTTLATGFAVVVTALWAIHPALTETVTYVSGRSMGLSSLLVVVMLLAGSGKPTMTNAALTAAAAFLAPLARETALIAPLILVWWHLTISHRDGDASLRAMPAAFGAAAAALAIALIPRHAELIAFSLQQKPPLEALRGNIHAAFDIVVYWVRPFLVTIDPAPPLAWGWLDTRSLAKISFFAGAAALAVIERRRSPLVAFGVGLALLALAPSNSFLWRADPVSLKPLYLGGLGLTLAASATLMLTLATRAGRWGLALAAASLTTALALGTVQRNTLFANEVALWADAAAKTPDYGRPWIMLGYALFNEGRYQEARDALQRGCDLDPLDQKAASALKLTQKLLAGRH